MPKLQSKIISIFKRSILTLLGSLILILSWYFEKIKLDEVQTEIDNSQRNIIEFTHCFQDCRVASFENENAQFSRDHDSLHFSNTDLATSYANACMAEI